VTMYAGGVKKGFVVVAALLVTAALQVLIDRRPPPWHVVAALPLVLSSSIIHQKYPYVQKQKKMA
jgi:UDP-sugar transporter A1/2/3